MCLCVCVSVNNIALTVSIKLIYRGVGVVGWVGGVGGGSPGPKDEVIRFRVRGGLGGGND